MRLTKLVTIPVKRIPIIAGVAAVATIGVGAVAAGVKLVGGVEKDSTADKVIDFVSDVAVTTACIIAL